MRISGPVYQEQGGNNGAVEDVRPRILMTGASAAVVAEAEAIETALRGAEVMASKGDRPQMMWKLEKGTVGEVVTSNVVDATPPKRQRTISSRP